SRIGPVKAEVVVFNKGGRDFRLERRAQGHEVPCEFFYGYFDLEKGGISASMMSSAGRLPGPFRPVADKVGRGVGALTSLGVRPLSTRLSAQYVDGAKVAISFIDGFSLSLGLGFPRHARRPVLIGGFHGLSDIEARAPPPARALVRSIIKRSLSGLDHVFFFGPSDREFALAQYGLSPERSSVIPFGVDT